MAETIGNLIDKLTVCNLKIWACEDIKHKPGATDEEIAAATRKTNILNPLRNDLIQEIDELILGLIDGSRTMKSYGQGSTKLYGKK